ncbi:hypothetical protein EVAR_98688_1 [Eumeta japonica]|uniref:Uncharacterized protein n=1 Tax=Eumeta variegata TaxID=151549 RepID=A0A4C1XX05_EUMVA|nr:hypothetical protein EVAR_98688_1 [Eumeta japonica]
MRAPPVPSGCGRGARGGRHASRWRPGGGARLAARDRRRADSGHEASLGTVTGRFPFLPPGRERSAAAGRMEWRGSLSQ